MTRTFDHDLLLRFLMEYYNHPRPVAEGMIEKLRLDGDGLMLDGVLQECDAWDTQMKREGTRGEE